MSDTKVNVMDNDRATITKAMRQDLEHLRKRLDWWHDLHGIDMKVYESVKKSVMENTEMINLVKQFLTREHGFDARKELELDKEKQNERRKKI
jgi:hypothetical protein|tara:strand:- start:161 stop:439 length:279 start_codon:yes stop_codon:yes gene_type:complete